MNSRGDVSFAEGPRGYRKGGAVQNKGSYIATHVSVESVLVFFWLTASLVVLPLILPPLPPPPFILLLVPIGILAVLFILALMTRDVTKTVMASVS